jgi:ribosomal-protein-alanine N-acetyltransferase
VGVGADPLVNAPSSRLPSSVVVELMTADDVPRVVAIERAAFESPWSAGQFLHELKIPFSRLRVARSAGDPTAVVGYACWWVIGDEVELQNLAVLAAERGRGIGRVLAEVVIDDAARSGARVVRLEVREGNHEARGLYDSLGFVPCGVRRNYYGRGADAIVMERVLGGDATAQG